MSITAGNTSSGTIDTGTTLTISHVVAAGSNCLVATCGCTTAISGATYGGVAMTLVEATATYLSTYILLDPSVGTADIVFTFDNLGGGGALAIGHNADFAGVNTDSGLSYGTATEANAGAATSDTVSPMSNAELDADLIYAVSFINSNQLQTPTNGQTELTDTAGGIRSLVTGYLTATNGTTTIGWSFTSSVYTIHAFALHPAGIAIITPSADTRMNSAAATTNYDTNTALNVGESNAAAAVHRSWIKPSFTGLPAGSVISAAVLKMTPTDDFSDNARTMYAHRCLRDVVSGQTTWNIWKTSNNWGTAGASNSTTDYDGAVVLGSGSIAASPTVNTQITVITFDAAELQKFNDSTYTNNGMILFVDTQSNDLIVYASLDHATAAYRPSMVYQYSAAFIPQVIWI